LLRGNRGDGRLLGDYEVVVLMSDGRHGAQLPALRYKPA
jgi:hypothetical protein